MGCKAITPHLVSLAKRLEGKPFHLLAAHCQNNTKDNVVSYIKGQGLAATTPNVTVSSFGGHPKVKGNGYVPYYAVFDQHGDLAYHHMCGNYHGGDGLKMIEWVDKLLKDVSAIYLGKEPFTVTGKLAKQVRAKKNLPASILAIEKKLAAAPTDTERAELERLKNAIEDYRTRMLEKSGSLLGSDPGAVIPALQDLQKDFKGTPLGGDVDLKLAEMRKSADLKESIKIWKSYQKSMRRLEKMKDPSAKARAKTADRLEKLIAGKDDLPITAKVKETIESLR